MGGGGFALADAERVTGWRLAIARAIPHDVGWRPRFMRLAGMGAVAGAVWAANFYT